MVQPESMVQQPEKKFAAIPVLQLQPNLHLNLKRLFKFEFLIFKKRNYSFEKFLIFSTLKHFYNPSLIKIKPEHIFFNFPFIFGEIIIG